MRRGSLLGGRWSRSIRFRVFVITVALTTALLLAVGLFVLEQVRSGVLSARQKSALSEASLVFGTARTTISSVAGQSPSTDDILDAVTHTLAQQIGTAGDYAVVISGTEPGSHGLKVPRDIDPASVPRELATALASAGTDQVVYQSATIKYLDPSLPSRAGMAVGTTVQVSPGVYYQIYCLFPYTQAAETIALVQRIVLIAGLFLVVLVGAISLVVSRQVVTPVRQAARVAERLADGHLNERLVVQREDEVARLATSFNRMAESLQAQIEQLEELSRVEHRFVSDVSHELRTPLTTVRMAADLLFEHRAEFAPATARAAELLQNQLNRFEEMLTDLLEISRHDAGMARLEVVSADVCELVRSVRDSVLPLIRSTGAPVVLRLADQPVFAELDRSRITRIVSNLLVNAIEHSEGNPVVVAVRANSQVVCVCVRDFGIGMTEEECAHAFDRFWRADPSRARTTGGTGLGLAIAQEDARLHGGRIEVWGRRGAGCNFRLVWPRSVGGPLSEPPIPLVPRTTVQLLARPDGDEIAAGRAAAGGVR